MAETREFMRFINGEAPLVSVAVGEADPNRVEEEPAAADDIRIALISLLTHFAVRVHFFVVGSGELAWLDIMVQIVADDGMADVRHVQPELMLAARERPEIHSREPVVALTVTQNTHFTASANLIIIDSNMPHITHRLLTFSSTRRLAWQCMTASRQSEH